MLHHQILMVRRLRVGSVLNVVIVAPVVKAQAAVNIHLIRNVLLTRIGLVAKVVRAIVRVRVAIIKAINLPN
jgi:hypothetical protein